MAGAVFFGMCYQLADNIQLMVTGENQLFGNIDLGLAVGHNGLLGFFLIADEFLQDVQKTILLQHILPQIGGHIATGRILGVAGTAVHTGAVATLVEGQEPGLGALQPGGHSDPVQIHCKVDQDAAVELERIFTGITVGHPLGNSIVHILSGQLILQFDSHQGDTVDSQHHIYAVLVFGTVMPLADALADVLAIIGGGHLVQFCLRLEVNDLKFLATVLEAVAQHIHKAVHIHGILECLVELPLRIALAALLKQCPGNRLSRFHKGAKGFNIQGIVLLERTHAVNLDTGAVTGIGSFLPAALRRCQRSFNINFKLLFIICHGLYHLSFSGNDLEN